MIKAYAQVFDNPASRRIVCSAITRVAERTRDRFGRRFLRLLRDRTDRLGMEPEFILGRALNDARKEVNHENNGFGLETRAERTLANKKRARVDLLVLSGGAAVLGAGLAFGNMMAAELVLAAAFLARLCMNAYRNHYAKTEGKILWLSSSLRKEVSRIEKEEVG